MGKNVPDVIIDLQLELCEGDEVHICTAEPTTYTEAKTTLNLVTAPINGANYVKANGDVSGRKNTCSPPSGAVASGSGTATHAAVTNSSDSSLRLVTTTPSTAITSGVLVDINPFAHEVRKPL